MDVFVMSATERDVIYRTEFWNAVSGDTLHQGEDLCVFDFAVNSGPQRALEIWRTTGGSGAGSAEIVNKVCDKRLAFLRGLNTWQYFGSGWSKRVSATALAMAAGEAPQTAPSTAAATVGTALSGAGAVIAYLQGGHGGPVLALILAGARDLRERVVAAVEEDGLSRRKAAAHFAVGISTVINWVRRFRETGSVLPGKMGGHKPKAIIGEHRTWLLLRIKEKDFTLRGLVAELAERGLKVDYRTVWNFVHAEKLSFKKTVLASEQDRPDVARRREQWKKYQTRIDPARAKRPFRSFSRVQHSLELNALFMLLLSAMLGPSCLKRHMLYRNDGLRYES
jgi:transposase